MVAKSFKNFIMLSEPFQKSGKMYINVQNPSTQTKRTVRWYSETEYYKMYPEEKKPAVSTSEDRPKEFRTQREVLGFGETDYITIFSHTRIDEDYFSASPARYAYLWGWYLPNDMDIPDDLPESATPHPLPWEIVGNPDGKLKSEAEVRAAVESIIYPRSHSTYQGEIGERLQLDIEVVENTPLENAFERYNIIIMEDADGNRYLWSTSAKDWPVGYKATIRGTVKEYKKWHGADTTVLTRCQER